ncbi:MAG: alpha/beta hydrolase family protein, partial [Ktedonobacteraceae bacterium]
MTRSTLLLSSLLSTSEPPPLSLAGDPVHFTRLTLFPNTPRMVFLDIYEPTTPPPPVPGGRGAIIDVPGAGDNRSVEQLGLLSQSLAREGIIDVNVGTPALFDYRVSAQEGEAVVLAFELMEHWPGVNPRHIGIITFSVGSLSAYIAAADPRIRDKVAFLGTLGGYADIASLVRSVGTHSQDINGQTQRWEPIATVAYVLYRSVSNLFSPADQKLLQKAFPLTTSFPPPLPTAQVARLSPAGAAYYHLLEGDQPGNVNRNLAALPPALKAQFTRLSPLSVISQIRAPIHLLHDRNDPAIPYSQDLEMASALAHLHHPYDL